ncbi:MAG: type II toxin-antitoxin system VapC family toxin [Deltaproteobacteria bacterium]|nr:type II toxin-antitoxin system VapC family toxin [Deltaproteobacteria bacterium]
MAGLVLETHSMVWFVLGSPLLSSTARERMRSAVGEGSPLHLPTICLVELVYLTEKGRLPAVVRHRVLHHLDDSESGFELAPLDRGVADALPRVSRNQVPDMPDRIITATALHLGLPLVTRDARIRDSCVEVVW